MAIAVDPPGTGDSDRPATGYDTGAVAATLHQLMRQLGHARYQVVGHDIGMWVAYALASDFPDAVSRLALTEAVIPGLAPEPTIFAPPDQNIFLWHFMFNRLPDLPEALIAGREQAYLTYMFDKWSHRRDRVAAQVYIDAYAAPGGLRAGFRTTGRFRKRCGRMSSAPGANWPCRCWPSAPSMPPATRR